MINLTTETETQLLAITRHFLLELEADRALKEITLDTSFEQELGIDSLGKVELFRRIEKVCSLRLPEEAIINTESLRDLINIIPQSHTIEPSPTIINAFTPSLETAEVDLSSAQTLVEVIHSFAKHHPNRPHLYFQNEQGMEQIISYGQMYTEAQRVANGLVQRGIQKGDTIAIMLPTSNEFFYAFFGVLLAGAIPVPIYPPFRPDKIEEYVKREAIILQNAQVKLLITFSSAQLLSKMLRVFIPSLNDVLTLHNLASSIQANLGYSVKPDDLALIQYTSGSTGDPKGVALTHRNILANMRAIGKGLSIKPTDGAVSWLPLYHDMGLISWLASYYFGIPLTILSPLTFLSRPEKWLWAIHYHRATISGGPNFAYELCVKKINPEDIEGLDLSSWRFAFNGAEAINPKTLERFSKKFSPYGFKIESFAPVYGLAESTVGLTFPPTLRAPRIDAIQRESFEKENKAIPALEKNHAMQFVACGVPLIDHHIRIVNDRGEEIPERTIGNIQFKGPSSAQYYYNNPSATQKARCDEWWNTGDLGYLADRELFITGRKKDLIIKAGRNLYPVEIEEAVSQVATIRKGCVIAFGIQDPKQGTEKLVVVAESYALSQEEQQPIRSQIIEKMVLQLGTPPDIIVLVPPTTVPKTSSGKLKRAACKQAYLEGKLSKPPLSQKLQITKLFFASIIQGTLNGMRYCAKIAYTIYVGLLVFCLFPLAWLLAIMLPKRSTATVSQYFTRIFHRLIGCPISIQGRENLSSKRPTIYVVNHASYVDATTLFTLLPKDIIFVAKKELLNAPLIRTFIKKLNVITVDRSDFAKSVDSKAQITACIQQGKSVVIFPEATFTSSPGIRPFKLGAFITAVEAQIPICTIAIQGTRSILRANSALAKPGQIKVTIGKAIYPEKTDWQEAIRLRAMARDEIAKNCGESMLDI